MLGISILQIFVYISYIFITVLYAWRTVKYARMPMHLRWELYPLPREKDRDYGGSYFEEIEWWKKPRQTSIMQDVIFIVKDYIYFMQYYGQNRRYWSVLYPLHIGFYLVFLLHVLMFIGGLVMVFNVPVAAESASFGVRFLYYITLVCGVAGIFIGALGCIGLLIKRIADKDQRAFTPPMYYFGYVFFLAMFVSGAVAWAFFDPTFSVYRHFWESLIRFQPVEIDAPTIVHIVLFSLFLIYMPFTRAMHYITKFFMFFSVRWDDAPNFRGGKLENRLQKLLTHPVSWSAPHIQTGKKWAEVATEVENKEETEGK